MAVISGAHAELIGSTLQEVFVDIGEELPLEYPFWCNVGQLDVIPKTVQQYTGLQTLGEKPEGSPFPGDEPIKGGSKTYTPTIYGKKVEVTQEMLRRDQFDLMRSMSGELAHVARNRREVNAHSVLNNAFDTSFIGFESGVSLISTSHTTVGSGDTLANRATAASSLDEASLSAELTRAHNLNNEQGLPQTLRPSWLIVPPDLREDARRLLGSTNRPFTAENEINALIEEDLRWMVDHYLTSTTAWFLTANKGQHDMWLYREVDPMFSTWDDPDTGSMFMAVYMSETAGFGSWRGVWGNPGA